MFVTGLLSWWYGAGWKALFARIGHRLWKAFDFFSIDLLIKTWFAPFRQISAGKVRGPLGVQLRAWLDRLVSRMVGGVIRTFMIIAGSIWLLVLLVAGFVHAVLWMIAPLLPVVGAILFATNWVPTW